MLSKSVLVGSDEDIYAGGRRQLSNSESMNAKVPGEFKTSLDGLTSEEARRRLSMYGSTSLPLRGSPFQSANQLQGNRFLSRDNNLINTAPNILELKLEPSKNPDTATCGSAFQMAVRGLWVIAKESGICIFSKYYKEPGVGDELFSGYMSALTSFLGELSADKGRLEKAASLSSSYSLATEDMKLSVRGFDDLMFVLAFDKGDNEETMNRVLRRLGEVFRAMYGERVKTDKKNSSLIDFKNFELVVDALIKSEAEKIEGARTKQLMGSSEQEPIPKNLVTDLNYIKGVNITVGASQLRGFDENKDSGYPIEMFSSDRKIAVNVLFKRFLHQHFSDWVKLIVDGVYKLGALPDMDRLRAALLYVDNSLNRKPTTPDKYTLQLMLSGSIAAYGSEEDSADSLQQPAD